MQEFRHIMFFEEGHKYMNINTKQLYKSVTQTIDIVKPEVNWDFWAVYKQLQEEGPVKAWYAKEMIHFNGGWHHYTKYLDKGKIKKGQWKEKADKGKEKGTFIHFYLENLFNNKVIAVPKKYKNTIGGAKKFYKDHRHLEPVYAEQVVGDDEYFIAGQIDRPFRLTTNKLAIYDFKGLALDTPIPTSEGFKTMQEISEGDLVFDGKGKLTKVIHVSSVHYNPCYKLTFGDNSTMIADHEHKWVIEKGVGKRSKTYTLTTEDLYKHIQVNNDLNKLKIKRFSNLERQDIELPIDPYVLGLWLADGSSHAGRITCAYSPIWKEIENRGYVTSKNLEKNKVKTEYRTLYGLQTELRKLNLLKNKHIPELYMKGSRSQRIDLLRGIMDGDGHYNTKRKNAVCITTQWWQAENLHSLVSSLGYNATIHKVIVKGFGLTKPGYHVTFSADINPFLCRNNDFPARKTYNQKHLYIKNVEITNTVPTKCIAVESKNRTYLAGRNYVKTHNTDTKIEFDNKYTALKPPFENMPDCNFSKYTIQVNMYRWIVERNTGWVVEYMKIVHLKDDSYDLYDVPRINVEPLADEVRRTHK